MQASVHLRFRTQAYGTVNLDTLDQLIGRQGCLFLTLRRRMKSLFSVSTFPHIDNHGGERGLRLLTFRPRPRQDSATGDRPQVHRGTLLPGLLSGEAYMVGISQYPVARFPSALCAGSFYALKVLTCFAVVVLLTSMPGFLISYLLIGESFVFCHCSFWSVEPVECELWRGMSCSKRCLLPGPFP